MTDKSSVSLQHDPSDESSLRYMLKLAAPAVITTISFTVMQFVDRFMVSRLGTNALAAILPASMVSFIPSAFAMGASTSLNTFVSQSLGRSDRKGCSNYYWQMMYIGFAYSILVLVIMWPMAPLIFKVMGHPQAVIEMESIYLRIMLYAHFLAVINWSSNNFFMGIHRPIITLYASLCGQIVNVVANYVLIFGKLGFPAMGIAGAGWGTFVGIAVANIVNIYVFLGNEINTVFHSRRTFGIDFGKMYDLLRVGLPAGFGLMVNVAFWGVILFALVGKFGTEALAATSAVYSYTNLAIMPVVGLGTALTALVGKTIGYDRKDLAIRQTVLCLRIAMIYMVVIGVCYFVFRDSLMAFWSSDKNVIDAGVSILLYAAVYQTFHAAGVIYSGSLRGAGDTVWLAVVSAIGALLILGLGGLLIVTLLPSLGLVGPWIASTLSIVAVGLANHWRFKSNKWMSIDLFRRRISNFPVDIEPINK